MSKSPRETDRLTKIVQSFPRVTVTVLGDMVADEFVFGEISRVSREAPVLILRHRERTVLPGGGAGAGHQGVGRQLALRSRPAAAERTLAEALRSERRGLGIG